MNETINETTYALDASTAAPDRPVRLANDGIDPWNSEP